MPFTALYVALLLTIVVVALIVRGAKFAIAALAVLVVLYFGLVMLVTRSM